MGSTVLGQGWMGWVVAGFLLLVPAHSRAEAASLGSYHQVAEVDRKRARELMDVGDAKMAQGDIEGALAAYRAADEIMRVPTTGIEVGRAQQALGLWVEARDTWMRVALYPKESDEPKPFTLARLEAERLVMALGPRIPTLLVIVARPAPKRFAVWLDDRLLSSEELGVALLVNPGMHRLRTSAPGHVPNAVDVKLEEGTQREATLRFRRTARPPAAKGDSGRLTPWLSAGPHSPALMWTGFSVAAAGVAVGTATGVWAFERTALAYEQCTGTSCPPTAAADIDQAKAAGVASTVAFVLGAAGLGVGIWQGIELSRGRHASPQPQPRPALSVLPGATGARLLLTTRFP